MVVYVDKFPERMTPVQDVRYETHGNIAQQGKAGVTIGLFKTTG